jgi:hypothetical protein
MLRRFKAVLGADQSDLELVLVSNGVAALALGVGALWSWDVSLRAAAALAALVFVALFACLFFRYAWRLPALLGALTAPLGLAAILAGYGARWHPLGAWAGALMGFACGAPMGYVAHARVSRLCRER